MRIYHTATQEDYDALMTELEEQGYYFAFYEKPTAVNIWDVYEENTCIISDNHNYIYIQNHNIAKKIYPEEPIIEYKADKKGEKQIKIYHTATQADYDALMIELEEQGFIWGSGIKPTEEFNYKEYTSETTVTTHENVIKYSCVRYEMEFNPEEPIIEYKAKKEGETDDFIKELTVKIYYNEVTKKHYNSYEEAIADCKEEMEKLHDKN